MVSSGYNEGHITYSVADMSLSGVSQVGGLVGVNVWWCGEQ